MSSLDRIARTVLIAGLSGGVASLAFADDPAIVKTVVVLEGDTVVGVGDVTSISNVAVNNSGDTLVEADTNNANTDIDSVLLASGALYLQEGQALGMPAGATLDTFDSVTLNDAGNSSFNLFLDGTSGSNDDSGIYFNTTLLIQESDIAAAAGFSANTPFIGFFDTKINESNDILILGTADDPNIASTVDQYLMIVDTVGNQTLFLKEGDQVPGVPGVFVSSFSTSTEHTSFNDSGSVMYFIDSDAATTEDGFVMIDQTVLAREGSASPVAGRLWSSLSGPELALNGSGDYVHSGSLDGDTSSNLLIVKNGAKFRQEGDTLPAIAPFTFTSFSSAPILIEARGARTADPCVLWYGDWNDPDTDVDTGLFLDGKLLLQEGVTTVNGMTIDTIGSFSETSAMSDNGRYVLVDVTFDGSLDAALLLDLGPWRNLGQGFTGSTSPKLRCFGQLAGGTPLTLEVSNAPANSTAVIVFGRTQVNIPFLGATLVPSPDRVLQNIPVDADGNLTMSFTVPNSFQPGATAYFQVWIFDPGSPIGFSVTNGVEGIGS